MTSLRVPCFDGDSGDPEARAEGELEGCGGVQRHSAVDCRLVTVLYVTHNTSKIPCMHALACPGVVNYMGDAYACPCMPIIVRAGRTI